MPSMVDRPRYEQHIYVLTKRARWLAGRLSSELPEGDARRAPVQREFDAITWALDVLRDLPPRALDAG